MIRLPALAATLALVLTPAAWAGETITGRAQVIDGDSIIVAGKELRLEGIDAPEWNQTCTEGKRKWPCGGQATAFLRSLIEAKAVSCAVLGRDRYKRRLVTCFKDGTDIAERLVREGWAIAYRRYSTRYVSAEDAAKNNRAGLWRGEFATPEKWRAQNR